MKIGLDIMGGDFAPQSTVEGAVLAQHKLSGHAQLVLFGDEELIRPELDRLNASADLFEIVDAKEIIEMGEHPTRALTQKPNSSIAQGFAYLKAGKIQSLASSGQSGRQAAPLRRRYTT